MGSPVEHGAIVVRVKKRKVVENTRVKASMYK
jgi:hypothetical protein